MLDGRLIVEAKSTAETFWIGDVVAASTVAPMMGVLDAATTVEVKTPLLSAARTIDVGNIACTALPTVFVAIFVVVAALTS